MHIHSNLKHILPILAIGFTAYASTPAHADDYGRTRGDRVTVRTSVGIPAPPQITFRRQPRWVTVPGTRVYVVNSQYRPEYDMFRFGSTYYIYDNGYWYRSTRWNGAFVSIDERDLPPAFHMVPRDEWRNYPSGWSDRYQNANDNGRHRGHRRHSNNGNGRY